MTRRELGRLAAAIFTAPAGRNRLETEIVRLQLRHTWTVATSTSDYRDNLYVRFTALGVTGIGEGAPLARYRENAREGQKALESLGEFLEAADPWQFGGIMEEVFQRIPGHYAAKCALDVALMDWVGKKLGIPLYCYFGVDPRRAPLTTYSIGIDTPELTRRKVREAADFPVLKIKVGLDTDEVTIQAVRSVTDKPLRVDANEGWKSRASS